MSPTISFTSETMMSSKSNTIYTRPAKKPKMSITQTYFLAHSARGKLSKEASRADHDLRLLVGHANMLDSLMLDLASAEQEQERWFNHSVPTVTAEVEEEASPEDLAMEEPEEADWDVEDAEASSEEEVDYDDDEEDDEGLTLVRTKSRHSHSPPELTIDMDSDSEEDEHIPASPPDHPLDVMTMTTKPHQQGTTTFYESTKEISLSSTEAESFEADGFYIPARSRPTIIAAC